MMVSCNKVLDRFYFKVLKKLYPKVASDDLSTFRRFCNLSIFTSGNTVDCTDSFLNTPHNDTTDVLFKEFQRTAQELLGDLRKKDPENHCLDVDIDYLERLSVACGGFAVPTTCGYDFVTSKRFSSNIQAHFAMIGLGVTVQLCPQCYHYFFGSSYTHCTPMALSIQRDLKVTTFSNGEANVVGWGGGKSVRREIYDRHGGPPVQRLIPSAFRHWLLNCNDQAAIDEAEQRGVND